MAPRAPDWDALAATGTEPGRLATTVRVAAADPRGFAARWRAAGQRGLAPAAAVREAAAAGVLDEGPGDHAARAWARAGAVVALAGDPGMPGRLERHGVTPPWLARTGREPGEGAAAAIVGSRRATGYGVGVAAWLAEVAGEAGVRVVSGGAVGIDAAAHGAAVGTPGVTTVVLGCGHGVAYPRAHAEPGGLFERVVASGGTILSAALPGDPPKPHRVRSRNRLVAALADAVVVVEGGARSGSLITASWAADLGIAVLAVPGDVRAPGSAAGHQLLRDGAAVCTGPADLLATVLEDVARHHDDAVPDAAGSGLPAGLQAVLAEAWPRPVSLPRLVAATGLDAGRVMAAVMRAQVAGVLTRDVDGLRLCRDPKASP